MITEKHDPWALLREAREDLALAYADIDALRQTRKMSTLTDRIDAALAVHDAVSPSEETVEWFDYGEWGSKSSKIDGFQLTVRAHGLPGPWHWEAPRSSGYAATKDEAKAAAIAAARGMR